MNNFLVVEHEILTNRNLQSADKLIIAFLRSYEKSGRYYFGSVQFLAQALGIELAFAKERIEKLKSVGIIYQSKEDLKMLVTLEQLKIFQVQKQTKNVLETALLAAIQSN